MNWPPGAHASTFGGNPVACAAGLVTVELLEKELIANAARIGAYMMDRLRDWPARFPIVGDVRGLGLMIGIELVRDQKTRERAAGLPATACSSWRSSAGCWCWARARTRIRLCPPLVITRDQADFAVDVLEECLKIAIREV